MASSQTAWGTGVEVDTLGFRVMSAATAEIDQAGVIAFVPSSCGGSFCGAEYTLLDIGLTPGSKRWYWLVDAGETGLETIHGPISLSFGAGATMYWVHLPLVTRTG